MSKTDLQKQIEGCLNSMCKDYKCVVTDYVIVETVLALDDYIQTFSSYLCTDVLSHLYKARDLLCVDNPMIENLDCIEKFVVDVYENRGCNNGRK